LTSGEGGEFTNLVLGFSEKVHKMASDLTIISIKKSQDERFKAHLFA